MITQIAAFISSFREEEGGPELVVGSNDVGFESWQEKLEIFTCFVVQKGTVCGGCAGAALAAQSKSWEEVFKNDLGGRAPWARSVLVAVLLPPISAQICVGQIGPQILHLVTFIMARVPLGF